MITELKETEMDSDKNLSVHLCQAMPNCNGVRVSEPHNFMDEYTCKLKGIKVGYCINRAPDERGH